MAELQRILTGPVRVIMTFAIPLLILSHAACGQEPLNMVPNGSFEEVDGSLPARWVCVKGSEQSFLCSDDRPRSGVRCIKLVPKGGPAWLQTSTSIPVGPGMTYRLRQYHRIDESNMTGGQAMYVRVSFLDANGQQLPRSQAQGVTCNTGGWARVCTDWRMQEVDFTVPEAARMITVTVSPGRGFEGVAAVDDVQIFKLAKRAFELPEGSLPFQFVAEDTDPAGGFTAVPFNRSFDEKKDFGWDIRPGEALSRAVRRIQDGYPTRLQSHGVRLRTFSCTLPNGEYTCSIYMGALWRTTINEMNHVVEVNRQVVVKDVRDYDQLMDEEYFRYVHGTLVTPDDIRRKGLAVYEKYIRPRYRRHDFTVTVADGRINVRATSGFMNAIIITPGGRTAQHRKAVEKLDKQLAEEFASSWAELLPTNPIRGAYRGEYKPNADDQQRGYVIFRRHWMQAVEYDSLPDPEDIGTRLAMFATPGEYEPATFSIWPLKDLHKVKVTTTSLRAEDGSLLPADSVRVWYLQQKQERRPRPCTAYYIQGTFLPDWNLRELFKDIVQRCWLNIKVPEDAKPGLYHGEVRFAPDNAPPTVLTLSLRVMPFNLRRPKRLHVMRRAANGVIIPYPCKYPVKPNDTRNKQFYRQAAIHDLYEHGFAPEFSIWWPAFYSREEGRILWDQDNPLAGPPRQFLQLIKDSPFGKQDTLFVDWGSVMRLDLLGAFGKGSEQWTVEDTRNSLKALRSALAAAGFSKAYLQATAEESHFPPGKGAEEWVNYLRFVRDNRAQWPNIFTVHTCNTAWGQPMAIKECDLPGLGMFHGAGLNGEEQVEMARAAGKPYVLYGCRGRMVPGFYLWKAGAVGTFHEFYGPFWGTPNNDWDNELGMDKNARQVLNEAPGWCNVTYSPTGRMIGSWFWEEMREGVDDDAYLTTLQSVIDETEGNQTPTVVAARRSAEEVLAEISDLIDLDIADVKGGRGLGLYRPFAPEDFDGLRWKAALAIARLKTALEGKSFPVEKAGEGVRPLLHRVHFEGEPQVVGGITRPISEPFVVRVREPKRAITVDGRLDEPCYSEQPQADNFIELSQNKPAEPPTAVYLLSGGRTLYVGVRCFEPRMSGLKMDETQENGTVWSDDCVEIFLDPGHTHRSYYHFGVNPRGTRALVWHPKVRTPGTLGDQQVVQKNWSVKTHLEKRAWTVEFAISLAEFEIKEPCFGMSVCRNACQYGVPSCWTYLPKRSFHQPEANADAYLPNASTVMERFTLGNLTAGRNLASVWVSEAPGAEAITMDMKTPGGSMQLLPVTRHKEDDGLVRYDAPYDLGAEMGDFEFKLRAGKTLLGRYDAHYDAAFFNATVARGLILSEMGKPINADIEMLVPPGTALDGFSFLVRALRDDQPVKEAKITDLKSRRIHCLLNLDDLPLGKYDVEIALVDEKGQQLKRTLSEFEVLPSPFPEGGQE